MSGIAEMFHHGGFFMWPITAVMVAVVAIVIERIYFLYFQATVRADELVSQLQRTIIAGDLAGAIRTSGASDNPLGRIIHAGLLKVKGDAEDVQAAMDEAALRDEAIQSVETLVEIHFFSSLRCSPRSMSSAAPFR